jgi:Transmembrane domain of unknown function (DUF3566)
MCLAPPSDHSRVSTLSRVSSNERHDPPGGGESAVPKQRSARPAPRVQRVSEATDPRTEVLSKRPGVASRPANAKRPSGARPLVVAADLESIPTAPIEVPPIESTNGSPNGAPQVKNPTSEVPIGPLDTPTAAPPASLKKDSSRRRRPDGATPVAGGAVALAPPFVTPDSPAVVRPAALAPDSRAPAVVPLPIGPDDEPGLDYPDSDSDASTATKGRTIIHYGPGGRRRRPRVRRVTRVVRHVDPWSVFKIALCFSFVLYGVCLTAGVLLWNVAYTTGTIDNIERFFESFGWDTFEFKGGELYHNAWIAGLFAAVGLTGLIVLGATLFNLITDLVGGVRVTVLEEEVVERHPAVARPILRRRTGEIRMVNEVPPSEPDVAPAPSVASAAPPPSPAPPPGFLS